MKRHTFIKDVCNFLDDRDVLIFTGKDMCNEAYRFHKSNFYYIDNYFGLSVSFALGIAMCTEKRVFIFVGEGDLLREFSIIFQLSVSRCNNIFLFIVDNGVYQSVGNFPNMFNSLKSKSGFMFHAGVSVFDFTSLFERHDTHTLGITFERLSGPSVILISVECGLKKDLNKCVSNYNEFSDFVKNKNLGTALFFPPTFSINTDNVNSDRVLNLDRQ